MALIGLSEAAKRLGVHAKSAQRTLEEAGVPLVRIHARAFAVEEANLERVIQDRAARGINGPGRPRKNKTESTGERSGENTSQTT